MNKADTLNQIVNDLKHLSVREAQAIKGRRHATDLLQWAEASRRYDELIAEARKDGKTLASGDKDALGYQAAENTRGAAFTRAENIIADQGLRAEHLEWKVTLRGHYNAAAAQVGLPQTTETGLPYSQKDLLDSMRLVIMHLALALTAARWLSDEHFEALTGYIREGIDDARGAVREVPIGI